jgi:hypothetical protein
MILRIRDSNGNIQEITAIKGDSYKLTEADKQEIAEMVSAVLSVQMAALEQTETWTFTMEDGSTVTKTVVLK